jgi:Zn-finger nucleic acid-binding protein
MNNSIRCTCAAQGRFKALELAPGLPARQCEACESALVSVGDYKRWRDKTMTSVEGYAALAEVIHGIVSTEESPGVRVCPHCSRLMQRLRVSAQQPSFRIDRCGPCQMVWLDRGEWDALSDSGLSMHLDEVLSDAWQRQLSESAQRSRHEAVLRARLGDDCVEEMTRIRAWLDQQPKRDEVLALLRTGW